MNVMRHLLLGKPWKHRPTTKDTFILKFYLKNNLKPQPVVCQCVETWEKVYHFIWTLNIFTLSDSFSFITRLQVDLGQRYRCVLSHYGSEAAIGWESWWIWRNWRIWRIWRTRKIWKIWRTWRTWRIWRIRRTWPNLKGSKRYTSHIVSSFRIIWQWWIWRVSDLPPLSLPLSVFNR